MAQQAQQDQVDQAGRPAPQAQQDLVDLAEQQVQVAQAEQAAAAPEAKDTLLMLVADRMFTADTAVAVEDLLLDMVHNQDMVFTAAEAEAATGAVMEDMNIVRNQVIPVVIFTDITQDVMFTAVTGDMEET